MAEWVERMRTVTVQAVAAELGVEATVRSNRWSAPCPACNAAKRHTKSRDKRGAVGVRSDGSGWRCFQCDEAGDALDFVAWHVGGGRFRELPEHRKLEVRGWCSAWLGLGGPSHVAPLRPSTPPLPAAEPEPPPNYPPAGEVAALWAACVRVDAHADVSRWLYDRRIVAADVADRDLARALPPDVHPRDLPAWARWWLPDHELVVQLVDAHGVVRSAVGRSLRPNPELKTAPPFVHGAPTFQKGGLVFACGLARQVLARGQPPEWWPSDVQLQLYVTEGEKKWCMRSTVCGDSDEYAPAAIGVGSGSWTEEMAARIPDGSVVYVTTDHNEAGANYATKIVRSLCNRSAIQIVLRPGYSLEAMNTVRCV